MGRPDAFYIPPEQFAAPFALTGGEAGHCAKVLRKRPGERVRAFDGTGRHGLFRIETVGRDRVELVPESLEESPLPARRLHVAAGFSRSSRRDFFLEKAVELGAAGIVFWQAERTQGKMPGDPKEAWTAGLIAAAKQCGAARLPTLACLPGGVAGLAQAGQAYPRRFLLWEDPAVSRPLTPADLTADGDTLCVVGPEGGFSDAEAATLTTAGFVPVTLGPRVLRWETAALAVLALGLTAEAR
ncbi:16S rRNA (uracil(1498)-N(3))-methyltransferase [Solidesulfovibrio carbinolicus]|uniref:Ribosomal RNA small subunit methyltransferase E n=1 Tax=Solidesulfovibrio carbinolicus TaxID=296842 RepID=A0A4P6HRY9_9BACT|nr:16S rRNA (uracil(1498)-N(3))-methyltransferase [Solidesulfovibrio carbinolicus]QAZ69474.1 16S rRNA (uracil(1498)-N(3))-methyltransferase [Solidesulfovibrio carbinolicus]